jgi:hypothetical protein
VRPRVAEFGRVVHVDPRADAAIHRDAWQRHGALGGHGARCRAEVVRRRGGDISERRRMSAPAAEREPGHNGSHEGPEKDAKRHPATVADAHARARRPSFEADRAV